MRQAGESTQRHGEEMLVGSLWGTVLRGDDVGEMKEGRRKVHSEREGSKSRGV
jgi:hypothetical protein